MFGAWPKPAKASSSRAWWFHACLLGRWWAPFSGYQCYFLLFWFDDMPQGILTLIKNRHPHLRLFLSRRLVSGSPSFFFFGFPLLLHLRNHFPPVFLQSVFSTKFLLLAHPSRKSLQRTQLSNCCPTTGSILDGDVKRAPVRRGYNGAEERIQWRTGDDTAKFFLGTRKNWCDWTGYFNVV